MGKAQRKIRVSASSWQEVEALCDAQSAGRRFFTVRGRHTLEVGDLLLLALSLPDELVLGIDVEVVAVARSGADWVARVEIAGFSPEMGTRLRSMALRGGTGHRDSAYLRLPTREDAPMLDHAPGLDRVPEEVGGHPHAEDSGAVLAALRPRPMPTNPAPGATRPGTAPAPDEPPDDDT